MVYVKSNSSDCSVFTGMDFGVCRSCVFYVSLVQLYSKLDWFLFRGYFLAVLLQVSIPMAAGYFLARWALFARQHVIAITVHTRICNTALSTTLAMEHISSLAALPAVANTVINLTIGAIVTKRFEKQSQETPKIELVD